MKTEIREFLKKILNASFLGRKMKPAIISIYNHLFVYMSHKQFYKQMNLYNHLNTRQTFIANKKNKFMCLKDIKDSAGTQDDYFWQDLYFAKQIYKNNPEVHYDIGSRLDGFIAHLLSFRESKKTVMIDIRPLKNSIEGLDFVQADASNLDPIVDGTIKSISSLHAMEHFGLGRYGDPIDPEACFKAMKSLQRVLSGGGGIIFFSACWSRRKSLLQCA